MSDNKRKKRFLKGSFLPKGKTRPQDLITVDNPKLAEFLAKLGEGGGVLSSDIVATIEVGGVTNVPVTFVAGTPLEDILRTILEGVPPPATASISNILLQLVNGDTISVGQTNPKMPGDEVSVENISYTVYDPDTTIGTISYEPSNQTAEDVPTVTSTLHDVTDYTFGGTTSDEPYTFADNQGGANISNLQRTFRLKAFDVENNPMSIQGASVLHFAPPAFMLNIAEGAAGDFGFDKWVNIKDVLAAGDITITGTDGLVVPQFKLYLTTSIYYPLVRHHHTGNYDYPNTDVEWLQDAPSTAQLGSGDQGVEVPFFSEATPYVHVFFIPAGGALNVSGASFSVINNGTQQVTGFVDHGIHTLDIGSSNVITSLEFSTSTSQCLIQYRIFSAPNPNSIGNGAGSQPIRFMS